MEDADLDALTPGWQLPIFSEAASDQAQIQIQKQDTVVISGAKQQSLDEEPSELLSSARPRYTLRSHQDQAPSSQPGQDGEAQKQAPPPKSLRITGMQNNGFLIPMQSMNTAKAPVRTPSVSDKGASSDAPSLREGSPARQSSGSGPPLSSSDLKRGPSNEGSLQQEGRGGSLASQTSELVRVVTSGKPPEPKPGSEGHGKAAVAEAKRRRKTEGLPTSRVTRSAVKKQQEDLPRGSQARSQGENAFNTEQPQMSLDFQQRLFGDADLGHASAAIPSNFYHSNHQVILVICRMVLHA